jgi:hypothetical protein
VLDRWALLAASPLALFAGCTGVEAPEPVPVVPAVEPAPTTLAPIDRAALTVTSGAVSGDADGALEIREPTVRAVANGHGGTDVEVALIYQGPTAETVPLASGEARRQIGLKLRAQDTCNVVYVMWHIEPTTGIHVAVKSNPGMNTDTECGDSGYDTLAPTWWREVAAISAGIPRTLRATIEGDFVVVMVDGEPVWTARLPPAALVLEGPVGLRSDNGDFDLVLRAPAYAQGGP